MENPPTQQPEEPAVEPDEFGLLAPYLRKFDFEDREHIDDSEFYGSDDDEEYRITNVYETVKKFLRQVRESRGYDVDCVPPPCMGSPFMPRELFKEDEEYYAEVIDVTKFAIGKINAETGKTYELVDVEKVVETRNFMMLLTFTAKEVVAEADVSADAAVKTFQAMVYVPLFKDRELEEWRIKQVPVATGA